MNSTQKQLEMQERIETLAEAIINTVEVLKAKVIDLIVNNEFDAAVPILETLATVNKLLNGTTV